LYLLFVGRRCNLVGVDEIDRIIEEV